MNLFKMLMSIAAVTATGPKIVGAQSEEKMCKSSPNKECDNFLEQANNEISFVTELSEKLGLIPKNMEKEEFADSYRIRISQRSNDCYLDAKKSHMKSGKVVYMGHSDVSNFGDLRLQSMQEEGHLVSSGPIDSQQGGVFADKRYASSESVEQVKNFAGLSCDKKHLIASHGQLPDGDRGVFTLHHCSEDIPSGFAKDSMVLNKEATGLFLQNLPGLSQQEKDNTWSVLQESLPTVTRGEEGKTFISEQEKQMQDNSESWFYVDEKSNPENAGLCSSIKKLVDSMEPNKRLTDHAKLTNVQYNLHGAEFVEKCQSAVVSLARQDYKNNDDSDDFYYQDMHYKCTDPNYIKNDYLSRVRGPVQDMMPDGTVYVPMKVGEKELTEFKSAVQESMCKKQGEAKGGFVQRILEQNESLHESRSI